jgi:hypothetical protein
MNLFIYLTPTIKTFRLQILLPFTVEEEKKTSHQKILLPFTVKEEKKN